LWLQHEHPSLLAVGIRRSWNEDLIYVIISVCYSGGKSSSRRIVYLYIRSGRRKWQRGNRGKRSRRRRSYVHGSISSFCPCGYRRCYILVVYYRKIEPWAICRIRSRVFGIGSRRKQSSGTPPCSYVVMRALVSLYVHQSMDFPYSPPVGSIVNRESDLYEVESPYGSTPRERYSIG